MGCVNDGRPVVRKGIPGDGTCVLFKARGKGKSNEKTSKAGKVGSDAAYSSSGR
jgi:hypothetical protein